MWWRYTVDDTYISLRYAENLTLGNGPVFNPGERTEGYSCPLWVFLLGFLHWIGCDSLLAAKAIGLFSALGLVALLYFSLQRQQCDPLIAGGAAVWLAILPGLHVYGCSGMETVPFAFAIATMVTLPILCPSATARAWLLPASLLTVATLRPEGPLLFAAISALWWFKADSKQVRWGIAIAGIVLLSLFLLRYHYYGRFLPNTYLAKPSPLMYALTTEPLGMAVIQRLYVSAYIHPFEALRSAGGVSIIFSGILALLFRKVDLGLLTAAVATIIGGVVVGYTPEDWMPENRFALPFLFPPLLLAALGVDAVRRLLSVEDFRKIRMALLLVLMLWSVFNVGVIAGLWMEYRNGDINTALNAETYVAIGKWLQEHSRENDQVLAYEIGAVGYFSKRNVVDHEGLITTEVAKIIHTAGGYSQVRESGSDVAMREIVRYCVAQKPEWFLVRSNSPLSLALGQPIPKEVANEAIQQALVEELGPSMVLRQVFLMRPRHATSADKYLLLQRQGTQ